MNDMRQECYGSYQRPSGTEPLETMRSQVRRWKSEYSDIRKHVSGRWVHRTALRKWEEWGPVGHVRLASSAAGTDQDHDRCTMWFMCLSQDELAVCVWNCILSVLMSNPIRSQPTLLYFEFPRWINKICIYLSIYLSSILQHSLYDPFCHCWSPWGNLQAMAFTEASEKMISSFLWAVVRVVVVTALCISKSCKVEKMPIGIFQPFALSSCKNASKT